MSDQTGFLEAIGAEPDDDAVRLIYADWLEENGQEARALFIRTQIEIAQLTNRHPNVLLLKDAKTKNLKRMRGVSPEESYEIVGRIEIGSRQQPQPNYIGEKIVHGYYAVVPDGMGERHFPLCSLVDPGLRFYTRELRLRALPHLDGDRVIFFTHHPEQTLTNLLRRQKELIIKYGLDALAGFVCPLVKADSFVRGFVEQVEVNGTRLEFLRCLLDEKAPLRRVVLTTNPDGAYWQFLTERHFRTIRRVTQEQTYSEWTQAVLHREFGTHIEFVLPPEYTAHEVQRIEESDRYGDGESTYIVRR